MSRMNKANPNRKHKSVTSVSLNITEPISVSLRLSPALARKLTRFCSETGVSRNSYISLLIADSFSDDRSDW